VPLALHSGREADHSPPCSAEVKEWVELYLHSPSTPSWRGAQLGRAQGQLYSLPLLPLIKLIRKNVGPSLTSLLDLTFWKLGADEMSHHCVSDSCVTFAFKLSRSFNLGVGRKLRVDSSFSF
jgi:hypothetical protein